MRRYLLVALAWLGALMACTSAEPRPPAGDTPVVRASLAPTTLQLLAQADDLEPALLDEFARESNTSVSVEEYADEEEALSLLQSRAFDLVVADNRFLARLIAERRLAPIAASSLAGFNAIEARLRNLPFDPENRYSVPLGWGTVGILFRTDQPRRFGSWAQFLETARLGSASAKVALLDDPLPALGAAAKSLGLSHNSAREEDWTAARAALAKARPGMLFDSTAWSDALLLGEVVAAQAYSDDAAFALTTNSDIQFGNPADGVLLWMRSLALPERSSHKAEALRLIEFLCRPESAARLSAHAYWLSPVPEAYNRVDASLAGLLRAATPDDQTFRRSEFVAPSTDTRRLIERLWADLNP